MNTYRNDSSNPTINAQRNLQGRSHYVDPDTLRFHKSRVLSARPMNDGLLFAIVTSDALDHNNTKRGFRFVIFDLFGDVVDRTPLGAAYRSSEMAIKALWKALNEIDAVGVTLAAIARAEHSHAQEMSELRAKLAALSDKQAA